MKRAYLCLIIAVTSVGCQLAAEPATETPTPALSAGAREVQITSTRDRGKVHQDMYARSLVLSDGSTRIAVLTLDCVGLRPVHTVQIREGIAKATGIPADHVTINNSHTHNAKWPSGEWQDGMTYGDWLVKTCVALTVEANEALEPCAIGYDRVPIQIGFNRRLVQDDGQVTMAINPDGPVVPWTDIIAIHATERSARIAVLFTYAAHPVITQFSDVISSDYPGSAIARLKKFLGGGGRPEDGGVFMFGQGCGANINAFPLRGGPEACDAVGAKLAPALLRANLEAITAGPIRAESLTLSLPYRQPPSVAEVEKAAGYAICGNRLRESEVQKLIKGEKITEEESVENPLVQVCKFKAGLETSHPGNGRCYRHGGNTDPSAKFSLLSHSSLSPRVREFFESEDLLDLRGAIGLIWAGADALMGENGDVDPARVQELGSLMSRVGNLTKQHNDIMEKRKITIEVPEFIAWAEHFYELAIRYIQEGEKNVQGFLSEAESYYNATVTLKVGLSGSGNSDTKIN